MSTRSCTSAPSKTLRCVPPTLNSCTHIRRPSHQRIMGQISACIIAMIVGMLTALPSLCGRRAPQQNWAVCACNGAHCLVTAACHPPDHHRGFGVTWPRSLHGTSRGLRRSPGKRIRLCRRTWLRVNVCLHTMTVRAHMRAHRRPPRPFPPCPPCRHNFNLNEGPISVEWFTGAETNVCFNALDRHVEAGLGSQVAFYW
jgi:hypothetical protein